MKARPISSFQDQFGTRGRSLPGKTTLLPPALAVFAIVLAVVESDGPNGSLAIASALVLVVGGALLWRPGEAPILLFIFAMQWAEASIGVFHANFLSEDMSAYSGHGGSPAQAVELSLAGILVLAIGMRLGAGAPQPAVTAVARAKALEIPVEKWFRLYIIGWAVAFVGQTFAWAIPGLTQPLLALSSLKWATFYMLAFATFVDPHRSRVYFLAAFMFEFAQGVGGYFSDFKTVFFVALLAKIATATRASVGAIVGVTVLGVILLGLGVVWTAVKSDFRAYVSGGSTAQIVTVDYEDRLAHLADLVEGLDEEKLGEAADKMMRRLSYVEFFGIVLDVVPQVVPHADGAIWLDAVTRPFMPRLFFPNKAIIADSERTNLYARGAAGNYADTSVSLGYVAESYIDFGLDGMMAPIFLWGLVAGQIFRWLQSWRQSTGVLGLSLGIGVLWPMMSLDSSVTKTFGAFILSTLIAWLTVKFVAPRWVPWLLVRR
jgi:hypothetical protein